MYQPPSPLLESPLLTSPPDEPFEASSPKLRSVRHSSISIEEFEAHGNRRSALLSHKSSLILTPALTDRSSQGEGVAQELRDSIERLNSVYALYGVEEEPVDTSPPPKGVLIISPRSSSLEASQMISGPFIPTRRKSLVPFESKPTRSILKNPSPPPESEKRNTLTAIKNIFTRRSIQAVN